MKTSHRGFLVGTVLGIAIGAMFFRSQVGHWPGFPYPNVSICSDNWIQIWKDSRSSENHAAAARFVVDNRILEGVTDAELNNLLHGIVVPCKDEYHCWGVLQSRKRVPGGIRIDNSPVTLCGRRDPDGTWHDWRVIPVLRVERREM